MILPTLLVLLALLTLIGFLLVPTPMLLASSLAHAGVLGTLLFVAVLVGKFLSSPADDCKGDESGGPP